MAPSENQSLVKRLCGLLSPKNPDETPCPPPQAPPTPPDSKRPSREFERVFNFFDEDGDGKISPAELRSCMRCMGEELSAEDAEDVVGCTDSDGDGLLGFEDFVKLVEVENEEEQRRDLQAAFEMYEEAAGEGCITPTSLRRTLHRLGERKSVEECVKMIQRFDLNGDGVLSFDEFRTMML